VVKNFPTVVLTGLRLKGTVVDMFLVYQQPKAKSPTQAVARGVRVLAWQDFLEEFQPK
jgi:hypothetical protein